MKQRISRLEGNKEIRRVLARHGTDLSYCTYSCTGTEVRLTGCLSKVDGSDFSVQQIEAIIQDCLRQLKGFTIHGDLDNWSFSQDHITFLGGDERQAIYFADDDQGEAA